VITVDDQTGALRPEHEKMIAEATVKADRMRAKTAEKFRALGFDDDDLKVIGVL